MVKTRLFIIIFLSLFLSVFSTSNINATWQEQLLIPGTSGITDTDWIQDGINGVVTYTNEGMLFDTTSGNTQEHSSILWTSQEFTNDIKIEYLFKRMDTNFEDGVSMLLIHGQGIGGEYPQDISTWSRPISDANFHRTMNHHTISYATFDKTLRSRINKGRNLVEPEYTNVNFFEPNVWHQVIVTLENNSLVMYVKNLNNQVEETYTWSLPSTYNKGRVGFRQMYMHKNLYKDIKISTLSANITPTQVPSPEPTPIATTSPTPTPSTGYNPKFDIDDNGVVNILDTIELVKYIFR